jgi:hypothetical protein
MINRKLFVSATDASGAFTGRGIVPVRRAMQVLDDFLAAGQDGQALFMVQSDHDGRIELRHRSGTIAAVVTARTARKAMLGGLLPAREAVVWRADALEAAQARQIVDAIFRLPGSAFRGAVEREMAP